MPTRNTLVVPCMVNSRLKTSGRKERGVGVCQLPPHERLAGDSGHREEDQRCCDVQNPEPFVVDCDEPKPFSFDGPGIAVSGWPTLSGE